MDRSNLILSPALDSENSSAFALSELIEWATAANRAVAPMDFPDALCYLMQERGITVEMLEEKSLLSVRTIERLRNDPNYNVTREHIVALSVGLSLPPIVSMELLKKAGLLMKNTFLHNTYSMILYGMYLSSIHAVNDLLVSMRLSPLTKLART